VSKSDFAAKDQILLWRNDRNADTEAESAWGGLGSRLNNTTGTMETLYYTYKHRVHSECVKPGCTKINIHRGGGGVVFTTVP